MSSSNPSISNQRPRIGVAAMVWKDDKLLLGERITQNESVWQFPGGHLEVEESVTECAVREVREETGIEVCDVALSIYTNELFEMAGHHYMTLFVSANYCSGQVKVLEPEKCRRWEWFHYNELPAPLFGPIINLLKQVHSLGELKAGLGTPAGGHI